MRGVPPLRTPLRSVSSGLQPLRGLRFRTVPSSVARCFASADFASLCVLEASAASRPPMKAVLPCLLGLLRPASATGGGLRAPPPVSAKILRIFGRGNCKEAILLWKMGFSSAKIAPSPPYTPPGTIETRKGFCSTIWHGRSASSFRHSAALLCDRLFRFHRCICSNPCDEK